MALWKPSAVNHWFWPQTPFPDAVALQPGDVVLIDTGNAGIKAVQQDRNATLRELAIQHPDKLRYVDDAWRWTHAAIYLGADHLLCEADPSGVHLGCLASSVESAHPVFIMRRVGVTKKMGRVIARAAYDYRRKGGYDFKAIVAIAVDAAYPSSERVDKFLCSTLCERSLLAPRCGLWKPKKGFIITPAYLRQSLDLRPVEYSSLSTK